MEKFVAIIGAMEEEVQTLGHLIEDRQRVDHPLFSQPIVTGAIGGNPVIIACCGIGKVNAALTTQYLIDHYPLKAVINSGVAGAISPSIKIGDIVIGHSSLQHDFDATNFGYSRGTIPGLANSVFAAEPKLVQSALKAATNVLASKAIHQGLVVSGDQFISSHEQRNNISLLFPTATCAEMEGAAIAQVAVLNKIPHLIIRAISDQADNTAPQDFDVYLMEVIPTLNKIVQELVFLFTN